VRRATLCVLALAAAVPAGLPAQAIALGASYGSYTLHEESATNGSSGPVLGLAAEAHRGRVGLRVDLARASLTPDDTARVSFTLTQVNVKLTYRTLAATTAELDRPSFDLELGISRRSSSPVFATQDVGAVSIGVRSEGRLGHSAGVWARGALLPVVRFNGGGSSGASVEVGLGTWLMLLHGRGRAELDYGLQRVDRTVLGVGVPIQTGITRIGLMLHL
jgi:hypothetical protein